MGQLMKFEYRLWTMNCINVKFPALDTCMMAI